jgi:hypothetical protein
MKMIWGADVNDFYGIIREQLAIIAAGAINGKRGGLISGRFDRGSRDGDHFDIAQPADGFDVKRPDKTGANQSCSHLSQATSLL